MSATNASITMTTSCFLLYLLVVSIAIKYFIKSKAMLFDVFGKIDFHSEQTRKQLVNTIDPPDLTYSIHFDLLWLIDMNASNSDSRSNILFSLIDLLST